MDSYFLSVILKNWDSIIVSAGCIFNKKKKRYDYTGTYMMIHFFRVASLARVNIFLILLPIKYISNVS